MKHSGNLNLIVRKQNVLKNNWEVKYQYFFDIQYKILLFQMLNIRSKVSVFRILDKVGDKVLEPSDNTNCRGLVDLRSGSDGSRDRETPYSSASTSNGPFPAMRLTLIIGPRKRSTRLERCGLLTLMATQGRIQWDIKNNWPLAFRLSSLTTLRARRDCIVTARAAQSLSPAACSATAIHTGRCKWEARRKKLITCQHK